MKLTILIIMGLLSFLIGACSKKSSATTVVDHTMEKPVGIVNTKATRPLAVAPSSSKFRPGQVWTFKTPPGQPNARLTILRVEDGGKVGRVVHIALSGVSYTGGHTEIPRLPFAESAIDKSVIALERESGTLPDFSEGYRMWREAFESGKGGVFSIDVADAFETVTGAIRDHK
jgi:hypothetical protein